MPLPVLQSWQNGIGSVGADNFNTFLQACLNFAQLRTFPGLQNMIVYVLGQNAPDDGLQGPFYYNQLATGVDDNTNIIQPFGVTVGRWLRVPTTQQAEFSARTPIVDINYLALTTDEWISYTVLSATRTVTLPLCSAASAGQIIAVGDESGNCSLTTSINVVTQGTDKFNASSSSFSIISPYSYVEFRNNGTNLWIVHE